MKAAVCYTTKYGSSEHAAEQLKERMNCDVDLYNIRKTPTIAIASYDVIVLGGSVYMGKVQKELQHFIEKNLDALLEKKIGLFLCAAYHGVAVLEKQYCDSFPQVLRSHANAKGFFGYEVQFEKAGLIDRMIFKKVLKASSSYSALDSEAINHFAQTLC